MKVHGKTQGLKATQVARLNKLAKTKLAPQVLLTVELARAMSELAAETNRMVGILAERNGKVAYAIIGEAERLYLPDIGRLRAGPGRLRGIRLLVAKPVRHAGNQKRGQPFDVDDDLITDLEKLGLDAVVAWEALSTGLPGRTTLASILPDEQLLPNGDVQRHRLEYFKQVHDINFDFGNFIRELEGELARKSTRVLAAEEEARDRAVVVGAYTTPKTIWQPSLDELKELCRTAGVHVVEAVVQRRKRVDPKTIIGKGKLEEICLNALHAGADLLIFDCDLAPSQLNTITDLTDLRVLDRTMLIMDIFARRAVSRGGKLQVELAQLRYSLPRLATKQEGLSRLTGGIGGQGPGETKLEVDRRRVRDRIAKLEREITKFTGQRELRRKRRNRRGIPTLAIVGYTNAGKSTLLNALTKSDAYVENALFATLDTTSRRLRFPKEREVVLIDTVGFIRDLPQGLMNAFRATLEELHDADLLLHVVDASDPLHDLRIEAVHKVLGELEVQDTPRLLVLNKTDLIDEELSEHMADRLGAVIISAQNRLGFEKLLNTASDLLWQEEVIEDTGAWAPESPSYPRAKES